MRENKVRTIWKTGECYCWSDTQQTWNVTTCPAPASGCCPTYEQDSSTGLLALAMLGSASRDLPSGYRAGTPFSVSITVQLPPAVVAVGLEDAPPAGWAVSDISDNGAWDSQHGKVKWGPFFAPQIPAAVTYRVTPPAGTSGQWCFAGTVSFDGVNQPITGELCLSPALCRGDVNCDGRVTFADIDPFVEALAGESAWNQHHPTCPWLNADCNGSGTVTFADIDPFVAVIGTTCP